MLNRQTWRCSFARCNRSPVIKKQHDPRRLEQNVEKNMGSELGPSHFCVLLLIIKWIQEVKVAGARTVTKHETSTFSQLNLGQSAFALLKKTYAHINHPKILLRPCEQKKLGFCLLIGYEV